MINVRVPPVMRAAAGGAREIPAHGETIGEVLDDLTSRFPQLREQLRYANVYLDGHDIRTLAELETPVEDGATIVLLPAMAGGSPYRPCGHESRLPSGSRE